MLLYFKVTLIKSSGNAAFTGLVKLRISGMDPNSYEHFAKCIDEIQDALFEES